MLKKNFKKLLDFYNDKNDFAISISVKENILNCTVFIPKMQQAETFFYQDHVADEDFDEISVDYKEFTKIIDDKAKAKFPFHFEFENGIMSIIQDSDSQKKLGEVKYSTCNYSHKLDEMDTVSIIKLNKEQLQHISIHDNVKTKMELYPELSAVTLYCCKNNLYLLSCDLTCIIATVFEATSHKELFFSLSSASIKNLLLFNNNNTNSIMNIYKKDSNIILKVMQVDKNNEESPLTSCYIKTCKIIDSIYKQSEINNVINQLTKMEFSSAISLNRSQLALLRSSCSDAKRLSDWDDKRSVIFQLDGMHISYNSNDIVSYNNGKLTGNFSGYSLHQLLNEATVTIDGKSKNELYLASFNAFKTFDILKNKNVYLIKPKTI